ncbi:hypothetical protein TREAZ_1923 [Leadbettera azotonutricia ZAS-9]|uniref:Uncharacterized protein n=1 Tax=Leadbettera azotonutricia (strain ATCC BAA-888 / DSM 13862 / ZAS-9) TaxID=545695 RepID=F5YAT2_LEAAZ|nr:hypothetical protein TREAZ_1923 [Leadbettera azotonutricia ZAS-9]
MVLYKINEYRNPLYSISEIIEAFEKNGGGKKFNPTTDRKEADQYAEYERWKEIVNQYFIYEEKIIRLMILLNDYNFDIVNGKNLKNYIIEMRHKRFEKEYADQEKERNENMTKEEREILKNKYLEITKILYKYDDKDDNWGKELENYFFAINAKLRKYIK